MSKPTRGFRPTRLQPTEILFSHDLILQAIAYIEDNPVRKGLVSDPADWKWSSARDRQGYNDVPLRVGEVNWELVDAE